MWGSAGDPVTHTALCSPPSQSPKGLPWHLVQTEVVWSLRGDWTLIREGKLVSCILGTLLSVSLATGPERTFQSSPTNVCRLSTQVRDVDGY